MLQCLDFAEPMKSPVSGSVITSHIEGNCSGSLLIVSFSKTQDMKFLCQIVCAIVDIF